MSERRCKYCGGKNAIYYNELIDTHYCIDCSQLAWEELILKKIETDIQPSEEIDIQFSEEKTDE